MPVSKYFNVTTVTAALLTYVVAMLMIYALRGNPDQVLAPEKKEAPVACKGEAIVVDYPFEGGYLAPHACKVQCQDKKQRYVLYKNGSATQCEDLPGCNDKGEDSGVTCVPSAVSEAATEKILN